MIRERAEIQLRAAALESGSEATVLEYLNSHGNWLEHVYVDALSLETDVEVIAEPGRTKVRDLLFKHLEARDLSIRSAQSATLFQNSVFDRIEDFAFKVFELALNQRRTELAIELIQRIPTLSPVFKHEDGDTTLHVAARRKLTPVVDQLLFGVTDLGVIAAENDDHQTALGIAATKGDLLTAGALLDAIERVSQSEVDLKLQKPLFEFLKLRPSSKMNADDLSDIVQRLVRIQPSTLYTYDEEGYPPYCRTVKDGNAVVARCLKRCIVSAFGEDEKSARKALYGEKSKSKELGLHFAAFNNPSHDFDRFVTDIERYRKNMTGLEYEETLFYLILPDFGNQISAKHHTEIEKLFEWLVNMNVSSILELCVLDSLAFPMDDDFFQAKVLDKVCIRDLNWRKVDMNIDILYQNQEFWKREYSKDSAINSGSVYNGLKKIHLYSSGNWSTLYHWASEDGLCRLEQLEEVTITILKPKESKIQRPYLNRLEEYRDRAENLLRRGPFKKYRSVTVELTELVLDLPQNETLTGDEKTSIPNMVSDQFSDCHSFLAEIMQANTSRAKALHDNPVKVAVIDNGADYVRTTISKNIQEGISFVHTANRKYILPWWFVADPHGPQMAYLIRTVNPFCQLYIARVGTSRDDVSLDYAVEAIEWAISKKVDLISISWTTKLEHPLLHEAIQLATRAKITVICSTADKGQDGEKVWPAHWPETISVSAASEHGARLEKSQKEVDVLMLGKNVSVKGPTYITKGSDDPISGSSVATALTTGVASLMLTFTRYANNDPEHWSYFKNPDKLRDLFKLMHHEDTKRPLVDPPILFVDKLKLNKHLWLTNFMHPDAVESVRTGGYGEA